MNIEIHRVFGKDYASYHLGTGGAKMEEATMQGEMGPRRWGEVDGYQHYLGDKTMWGTGWGREGRRRQEWLLRFYIGRWDGFAMAQGVPTLGTLYSTVTPSPGQLLLVLPLSIQASLGQSQPPYLIPGPAWFLFYTFTFLCVFIQCVIMLPFV